VPFGAVANRLVEQHAGPARAADDGHLAGGGRHGFEVHQRLGERHVDGAVPSLGLEQAVIEAAAAEAVIAGLAAAVPLDDDLHVEADERPHVMRDEAVRANDLDHAPAAGERHRDLHDTRVAGARGRVDPLAERDLLREGNGAQRIGIGVKRGVRATRRGRLGSRHRIEHRHRLGRAPDGGLGKLVGMGEGGGLAGDAAQAEARLGVEVRRLQPPVVKAERLGRRILEEELAIVAALERFGGEPERRVGIKSLGTVEEAAGIGGNVHAADIVGSRLRYTLIRGPAFEDEPFIAIAAVDEALLVDLEVDARMSERGRDVAGTVAGDAGGGDVADLGNEGIVGQHRRAP
jgi:hypothetical protein